MTRVNVSRVHFPVTTLGPGRRIGIWFQGCSVRCPGCISVDTWGFEAGKTTVGQVLTTVAPWLQEADGVTISGGEPFDQPDALVALLHGLKLHPEQDTLVFSGHPVERLSSTLGRVQGLIDALISDPFQLASPQTLALRGSDNQRLHLLTERGRGHFARYESRLSDVDQALDIMFDEDGTVWLAGIPRRDDMRRLRHLLGEQGHTVVTSDVTHRDGS